jgi:SOS-response transcriptional repressor LexA
MGTAIKWLREERGWTQEELGAKVGLDGTNIARRESGKTKVKPEERHKFAAAFGMSLIEFDERWRQWTVTRTRGGPGIPIINRAPAGEVRDYEEYGVDSGQGFEYVDAGDIDDPLAFGVIVVGDSMEPRLKEGDYVILSPVDPYKPTDKLANGKIVFVRFTADHDGGCVLARFFAEKDGQIRLQKDNPNYKAIVCDRNDIVSVAVAVERREKL